jgi:hypothetical protein
MESKNPGLSDSSWVWICFYTHGRFLLFSFLCVCVHLYVFVCVSFCVHSCVVFLCIWNQRNEWKCMLVYNLYKGKWMKNPVPHRPNNCALLQPWGSSVDIYKPTICFIVKISYIGPSNTEYVSCNLWLCSFYFVEFFAYGNAKLNDEVAFVHLSFSF